MSAIDFALRYASQGLPVVPIWPALKFERGFTCGCGKGTQCRQPAKHPLGALVRNGCKDATTDEKKIREWWMVWPDANIGIATGDVVVIDIDPRHGGDQALAELEAKHGKLPPTWRVNTGGGGQHIFFHAPAGVVIKNSAGELGNGIDVRGRGGYVVAPPSNHVSGGVYEWDQDAGEIAPIPKWLVEMLVKPAAAAKIATPAEGWRELVRNGVSEGQRNAVAARLTGYLLRKFIDPLVVLELVQSWNLTRFTPPLSPDEITQIVNSVAGRELKRRQAPA